MERNIPNRGPRRTAFFATFAALVFAATAGPAVAGRGGGGNGGGGGEPPACGTTEIELCASFDPAGGIALLDPVTQTVDPARQTICNNNRKNHLITLDESRGGRFQYLANGKGQHPAVPARDDMSSCYGTNCPLEPVEWIEASWATWGEWICTATDPISGHCTDWQDTDHNLAFECMQPGETAWTTLAFCRPRWAPPSLLAPEPYCGQDLCGLSTPVRVDRIDDDNWVVSATSPNDIACHDGYFYQIPFHFELCRVGSPGCGPSDF